MRRIRTKSIANWNPKNAPKERRDLINKARGAIGKEQRGEETAPVFMNVPDHLAPPRAKPGRKPIAPVSVSITLTQAHLDKANQLGQNNTSAGIRKALDAYPEE